MLQTGRQVLGYLTRWPGMLLHGWLHWRNKLLVSWCFQEIILLCMKAVLILCLKCILCNNGSALLKVLCTRLIPHTGTMWAFCWGSHGLWHWCLVGPKVFFCSQMYLPTLCAMRFWGYVLMVWACSTWFVIFLGFFTIDVLGTYCQYHWEPIQSDFSMSWYTSLPHLWCAFLEVPIRILPGFTCQTFLGICRLHFPASGCWVWTPFQWGICTVWRKTSIFLVRSSSWGDQLILHWNHSHKLGRHIFCSCLKWLGTDLFSQCRHVLFFYGWKYEVFHCCVCSIEWFRCSWFTLIFWTCIFGGLGWPLVLTGLVQIPHYCCLTLG